MALVLLWSRLACLKSTLPSLLVKYLCTSFCGKTACRWWGPRLVKVYVDITGYFANPTHRETHTLGHTIGPTDEQEQGGSPNLAGMK